MNVHCRSYISWWEPADVLIYNLENWSRQSQRGQMSELEFHQQLPCIYWKGISDILMSKQTDLEIRRKSFLSSPFCLSSSNLERNKGYFKYDILSVLDCKFQASIIPSAFFTCCSIVKTKSPKLVEWVLYVMLAIPFTCDLCATVILGKMSE